MRTVTKEEYEADLRRGYITYEFYPARVDVLKDARTGREITREIPATITHRCMRCQFDSVYEDKVKEHIWRGDHPWPYEPFWNPYGHEADVQIEGIADYPLAMKDANKQ